MKYLLVILGLMFVVFISFSQSVKPNGIGCIKIGYDSQKIFDSIDQYQHSEIVELKKGGTLVSDCPSVRQYKIDKINISGIEFDNVNLRFYFDTLYSIETNGSIKIEEAFSAKYGEPEFIPTTKIVTCRYTYTGATSDLEEHTYFKKWRYDKIQCYTLFMTWYDDECKKCYAFNFVIKKIDNYSNKKIENLISDCEIEQRNHRSEKEKNDLKSKLDKL